jgi:hypothetical protein
MRTLVLGGVLAGALLFPTPASAGCDGQNPLPDAGDATPRVTIVNRATGERRTFAARPTDPSAGTYAARVVFPSDGTWSYRVFDGFTSWNGEPAPCAQTHTFKDVEIGGPGSGGGGGSAADVAGSPPPDEAATSAAAEFPLWPVVGAFGGLLLALVGAGAYLVRRARSRPAAA